MIEKIKENEEEDVMVDFNKKYNLILGDCLVKLKEIPDDSIDSIVTDPPYGISFMGKKWDYSVPSVDIWKECLRVLKPGGHLLSFSSARTYHRMAINVEDAGFEIRDQIMWVYGSGFPKSHNIGKAIDKKLGNEREVIGKRNHMNSSGSNDGYKRPIDEERIKNGVEITKGSSQYEGWGTALKPAHEPIVLARKPFKGDVASNVLEHGTGAINIDDCRVGDNGGTKHIKEVVDKGRSVYKGGINSGAFGEKVEGLGRWPANFIHHGLEEEWSEFFHNTKTTHESIVMARKPFEGDVASNVLEHGTGAINIDDCRVELNGNENLNASQASSKSTFSANSKDWSTSTYKENGRWPANFIHDGLEEEWSNFFYCAKASKKDRNEGCEELEEKQYSSDDRNVITDFPKMRMSNLATNHHPTVKPTDLMRYLCRLVTPKNGIVLDPFMGSGSTGKAALLENFSFIGIELSEEYLNIAEKRIKNIIT